MVIWMDGEPESCPIRLVDFDPNTVDVLLHVVFASREICSEVVFNSEVFEITDFDFLSEWHSE